MNMGINYEKLSQAFYELYKSMQPIVERLQECWNDIVRTFEELEVPEVNKVNKPLWNTPRKIFLKGQVFNRKPLLARARSNC